MSEPLDTMKVVDKETGEECIINEMDFDPDKHEPVVDDVSGGDMQEDNPEKEA